MYAKVFRSLWDGTLAGSGETWAVFVFLLADCNRDGIVDTHPKVISALTGFPEDRVRKALAELESADFSSRTEAEQGARIVRTDEHRDWGWQIVNHEKYRNLRDADHERALTRERVKKHRERRNAAALGNAPSNGSKRQAEAVTDSEAIEPTPLLTDASGAVGEAPPNPESQPRVEGKPCPPDHATRRESAEFFLSDFWPAYPRKVGRKKALAAYLAETKNGNGFHPHATLYAVQQGLGRANGAWRGREPEKIPHPATWLGQRRWEDEHAS